MLTSRSTPRRSSRPSPRCRVSAHFGIDELAVGKSKDRRGFARSPERRPSATGTRSSPSGTDIQHGEPQAFRAACSTIDPQAAEIYDTLGYQDLDARACRLPTAGRRTSAPTRRHGRSSVEGRRRRCDFLHADRAHLDWLVRATSAAGKSDDSQAAVMAMFGDLSVAKAKLSVTDRSLLDRAFALVAERQGLNDRRRGLPANRCARRCRS